MIKEYNGINYSTPQVFLLNDPGLGIGEIAARNCYDSFDKSENKIVRDLDLGRLQEVEHSNLLDTLAWVHFHHSVIEHINLSYLIRGTSRGVLQEHARHRIQSISVRSTRYTMSDVINIFIIYLWLGKSEGWFIEEILKLDLFVTTDDDYNELQIIDILRKLEFQLGVLGNMDFFSKTIHPKSLGDFLNSSNDEECWEILERKKYKNVGNAFKHIVNDNWKTDIVSTFNLRSLKNYLNLRDSLAAWFQIQWLSEEMQLVTPRKYLDLIVKQKVNL